MLFIILSNSFLKVATLNAVYIYKVVMHRVISTLDYKSVVNQPQTVRRVHLLLCGVVQTKLPGKEKCMRTISPSHVLFFPSSVFPSVSLSFLSFTSLLPLPSYPFPPPGPPP